MSWTCPEWDPSAPDAYRPLPSDRRAIDEGYVYDPAKARIARDFLETLCLQRRPPFRGKPLELMDWQRTHLVNPAFGWVHSETGNRRFRRWSIWTPKKCGKTSGTGAVALLLTCEAPATETYWLSVKAVQAQEVLYPEVAHMATAHPAFEGRFHCQPYFRKITDTVNDSWIKILAPKADSADGYSGNIIIDEFAAFSPDQAAKLWEKVRYAHSARPNGVVATISTAQHNRASVAYDHFKAARKAEREDTGEWRLLPVVFALEEGESWEDPEVWKRVNPSAGTTFPLEQLAEDYADARNSRKAEHSFRCLRLNEWAGSAERWFTQGSWDACVEPDDFDVETLRSKCESGEAEAVVGCDWGRSVDLTYGVVLVREGDLVHVVDPQGWLPEDLLSERSKADGIDYRAMVGAGSCAATPGNVVDAAHFHRWVVEACRRWHTRRVAADGSKFESSRQSLEEEGLEMVTIGNAWNVTGPAGTRLEELVVSGRLRHPDDPLLNVCFRNARPDVSPWEDYVRPEKARIGEKIDGVMATIYGLALMFAGEEEPESEPVCFSL